MNKFLYSFFALVGLLIFDGCQIHNNMLLGKWTSLATIKDTAFIINFKDDNTFTTEFKREHFNQFGEGRYNVKGNSLLIKDILDTPFVMCDYRDTGTYTFLKKGDTIYFKTITDNCERRQLALEIPLVKIKE